jgi:hypothetical protein
MHVYVTNVLFYCVIVFYVIFGKKLIRACVCMLNNPTLNKAYLFIYHYFCYILFLILNSVQIINSITKGYMHAMIGSFMIPHPLIADM